MAAQAEAFFQKLPTCVNRDFIDQVKYLLSQYSVSEFLDKYVVDL